MLVPRSYRYSSSPPSREKSSFDEKTATTSRWSPKSAARDVSPVPKVVQRRQSLRPELLPVRAATEPVVVSSKPTATVPIPVPERLSMAEAHKMPTTPPTTPSRPATQRRKGSPASHDPTALPPAVAALLAVTHIPRPKSNQFQRQRRRHASSPALRRVSIDELVNEWKSDESLNNSLSSSPVLSILLEGTDEDDDEACPDDDDATPTEEGSSLQSRSTSAESVPSLDADDTSILSSLETPSTPGSLRSRKSNSNLRLRHRTRSSPAGKDCAFDHPLIPSAAPSSTDDTDAAFPRTPSRSSRNLASKQKSGFTSNLTLSLQALKTAAINSLSSLTSSPPRNSLSSSTPLLNDDVLWSHPFLFPRFSSEVHPASTSNLSPPPLTFEDQEVPFQRALHAPYLTAPAATAPAPIAIQMQNYCRATRTFSKPSSKRNNPSRSTNSAAESPDPSSEAGRALLGSGLRHREPRENADFLRVVVMEMNMRRMGKLEMGKARIWLPPRQPTLLSGQLGSESESEEVVEVKEGRRRRVVRSVPRRWVGVSAY